MGLAVTSVFSVCTFIGLIGVFIENRLLVALVTVTFVIAAVLAFINKNYWVVAFDIWITFESIQMLFLLSQKKVDLGDSEMLR